MYSRSHDGDEQISPPALPLHCGVFGLVLDTCLFVYRGFHGTLFIGTISQMTFQFPKTCSLVHQKNMYYFFDRSVKCFRGQNE